MLRRRTLIIFLLLTLTGSFVFAEEGVSPPQVNVRQTSLSEYFNQVSDHQSRIEAMDTFIKSLRKADDEQKGLRIAPKASSTLDPDLVKTFNQLKAAIVACDVEAVADFVSFPAEDLAFMTDNCTGTIDREGFLEGFYELFNSYGIQVISGLTAKDLQIAGDEYYFLFKMGEDVTEPDANGEYSIAASGYVGLKKVNGKWMVVRFAATA